MGKLQSITYDNCSLMMFVDEGCLFKKLLLHGEWFPESAPCLVNVAFPFCSLIVHDSVRFVREHFDPSCALDSQAVNRLRNATKSLSSPGFGVGEYAKEVSEVVDCLNKRFKCHTGVFGGLRNSIQPDVEIGYYKKSPVYTTFNMARYLSKYDPSNVEAIFDPEAVKNIGYDIGQAASLSYYTVEALGVELGMLAVEKFSLTNKASYYSDIQRPTVDSGLANPIYFFMLCEQLMQLNSISALVDGGFFSEPLEIKMTTAVLVALEKSLSKLSGYMMKHPEFEGDAARANEVLSKIVSRDQRKIIKKSKDLRNALVHYDFTKMLGEEICVCRDAEEVLSLATYRAVGMQPMDYLCWLREARGMIANNIESIVLLPRC